jgi:RNA polymerase sigma-70 factor (ECF subfamily)
MAMDDDATIAKRVLDGEKNAFALLVDKYQRPIFNFVYRFFGNYDLAGELAQETFLKCYQSLRSFDRTRKFSTWIFTIAKNLCIDEYKRRKSGTMVPLEEYPEVLDSSRHGTAQSNPQAQCILKEEGNRLMTAIKELDADKKVVLLLHYYQGMSYGEIAETLSIPVSIVKIRIFRAKRALLRELGESGHDGSA